MQTGIHYSLHIIFPLFIAVIFFKKEWKKTYLILLLTMLVDLDHLLATPVFQANRCSIGLHPLHSVYAIAAYFILLFLRKPYRIIGIGLLFHMFTDSVDCLFIFSKCSDCYAKSPIYELINFILKILNK